MTGCGGDTPTDLHRWYGVRRGFEPGVYPSWEDARRQVEGYVGAEYRVFRSFAAAQVWAAGYDMAALAVELLGREGITVAHVAGGAGAGFYAYASLVTSPDGKRHVISGIGEDAAALRVGPLAGELSAVMHTISWCRRMGVRELAVFHARRESGMWADRLSSPPSPLAASYSRYVLAARPLVSFNLVTERAGDRFSEDVDRLLRSTMRTRPPVGGLPEERVQTPEGDGRWKTRSST